MTAPRLLLGTSPTAGARNFTHSAARSGGDKIDRDYLNGCARLEGRGLTVQTRLAMGRIRRPSCQVLREQCVDLIAIRRAATASSMTSCSRDADKVRHLVKVPVPPAPAPFNSQ